MSRDAIDIGTNSVKLLVADVDGAVVHPVWEESEQTRLGQGFYPAHQLQADAIAKSSVAVARLRNRAVERDATSVRAFATSAVRDAINQTELVEAVHAASGLTVEVVSGEQEADWAFAGVCTDPDLSNERLVILDVGGGSTEIILGHAAHRDFRASYPIGTVRLLETLRPADPPAADWPRCQDHLTQLFATELQPVLQPVLRAAGTGPAQFVGTGGTTSILAAMELRLARFDRERIWYFQKVLWSTPLAERRRLPGLPPNRADVILFGVAIYAVLMGMFGFDTLRVSTRGIRFGALL